MPKTLEEFRAQNLRLLEKISPDDPDYIKRWMSEFDLKHGIKPEAARRSPRKQRAASLGQAASCARSK